MRGCSGGRPQLVLKTSIQCASTICDLGTVGPVVLVLPHLAVLVDPAVASPVGSYGPRVTGGGPGGGRGGTEIDARVAAPGARFISDGKGRRR